MTQPRVIAHRGASHAHPDNSWPAFAAAVEEGADAIECDVQVTADGVLVVRHDLAVGGDLVAEISAEEVEQRAPETVRFATLLAWQRDRRAGLLVEIKDRAAVPALASVLPAERDRGIVVGGFDTLALRELKALRPDIRTSAMIGSVIDIDAMIALARSVGADGVHPCWEARAPRASHLLTQRDVQALHDAGLAVTLWHEERPDELRALVALGVDAICTDTPAQLRAIIASAAERTA